MRLKSGDDFVPLDHGGRIVALKICLVLLDQPPRPEADGLGHFLFDIYPRIRKRRATTRQPWDFSRSDNGNAGKDSIRQNDIERFRQTDLHHEIHRANQISEIFRLHPVMLDQFGMIGILQEDVPQIFEDWIAVAFNPIAIDVEPQEGIIVLCELQGGQGLDDNVLERTYGAKTADV